MPRSYEKIPIRKNTPAGFADSHHFYVGNIWKFLRKELISLLNTNRQNMLT